MIIVDDRGGSGGTVAAQKRRDALRSRGVDAELGRLDYGDYAMVGNGPQGDVTIGIELKTTRDIVSSLRSNRLMGHQVPGLVEMYQRPWLLTEGIWKEGPDGEFQVYLGSWQTFSAGSRTVRMSDIEGWILSTVQLGGLAYWHCALQTDTARFIAGLHRWWCEKTFAEHRSHLVVYHPPPDRALFTEPSDFVKMVSCIPKVGWTRALAIEKATSGSFRALMGMSMKDLQGIEGVGRQIAENIRLTLHGRQL
ncbi:MAG TPA: ERCC4 domain-containing protein [Thermoanaerobaculia bacterium]|nr:ERCC4 domain-containing protein [Thermoanaerobaculia bacterium]